MPLYKLSMGCLMSGALCLALGCGGPAAAPPATAGSDMETSEAAAASVELPADESEMAEPAAEIEQPAEVAQAPVLEPEPAQEPEPANKPEPVAQAPEAQPEKNAEPEKRSNKVRLGSPELTAGIPGEGPLTVEQIRAWLDDPANHEVLEVELPLGLAAGANQITGLDENPLTRAKIELGRQLYFDTRLSADATVSCASCHHPDEGYSRHTQFGVGIQDQEGGRNSPVSYNRILSGAQFWDGRAASLEEQAVGPIANAIEMGNTHEACVECLEGIEGYRLQFAALFGEEGVTIDNVGKALASFERVIVTGPTPFDYQEQLRPFLQFSEEDLAEFKEDDPELYARYENALASAKANPMSESALRGRDLFFSERVGCTACHVGANLTDEKYHNLGVGMDKDEPDLGRYEVTGEEQDRGAYKTPTIRNVALSAPYMHDGSQKTLMEVVEWYDKGGHPNPHLSDKIKKLELKEQEKKDLVAFMEACTGPFPKVETERLPE